LARQCGQNTLHAAVMQTARVKREVIDHVITGVYFAVSVIEFYRCSVRGSVTAKCPEFG